MLPQLKHHRTDLTQLLFGLFNYFELFFGKKINLLIHISNIIDINIKSRVLR